MSQSIEEAKQSELKQQAIEWLIRLRSDNVNDDELNSFANWMAEDYTHSEAFLAAENLFAEMSEVEKYKLTEANHPSIPVLQEAQSQTERLQSHTQSKSRVRITDQRWLIPSLAISFIWFFAVVLFFPQQMHLLDKLISDYHTQTGEIQQLDLADGSQLLLNTNSAVSVDYDQSIRQITLHHGQVRFTVAKDTVRPFEVVINKLKVRSLGTVFQISKLDSNEIKVTVQEHAVAVHFNGDQRIFENQLVERVTLETGQRLHFQTGDIQLQPETVDLNQLTAWQRRRLIINDQPLGDLLVELARYRNGRIFLSDNSIKSLRISGVFSLDNPDAVLTSICKALNLKQSGLGPWWVVLHH